MNDLEKDLIKILYLSNIIINFDNKYELDNKYEYEYNVYLYTKIIPNRNNSINIYNDLHIKSCDIKSSDNSFFFRYTYSEATKYFVINNLFNDIDIKNILLNDMKLLLGNYTLEFNPYINDSAKIIKEIVIDYFKSRFFKDLKYEIFNIKISHKELIDLILI